MRVLYLGSRSVGQGLRVRVSGSGSRDGARMRVRIWGGSRIQDPGVPGSDPSTHRSTHRPIDRPMDRPIDPSIDPWIDPYLGSRGPGMTLK